jgi:hypothetical protein
VAAAKATLDLEAIAVFNAAPLLSVGGPVGFVPDGSVRVLVVPVAVISLGTEALASLDEADASFVFRRTGPDRGLAVFEVAETVSALGAEFFASVYQTGLDPRGGPWFASRSGRTVPRSGRHRSTAYRILRHGCRRSGCIDFCFSCCVSICFSGGFLAGSIFVFVVSLLEIGGTRLSLATAFGGFGRSFDTIVQVVLAEVLLLLLVAVFLITITIVIAIGILRHRLLLAGFHLAQSTLEFEHAKGFLCAGCRRLVSGRSDGRTSSSINGSIGSSRSIGFVRCFLSYSVNMFFVFLDVRILGGRGCIH